MTDRPEMFDWSDTCDYMDKLEADNARLRSALTQFVAACDTAPPTSLMVEIGIARNAAVAALAQV
jgi:hypothetical protein